MSMLTLPRPVTIWLTDDEVRLAMLAARLRHRDGNPADLDVVGCLSELAVARHLGVAWIGFSPNPGRIKADLGVDVEVRATRNLDGGLIVRASDHGTHRFILCHVDGPRVELVGWLTGVEAKSPEHLRAEGRPFWLVPAQRLHPIGSLDP